MRIRRRLVVALLMSVLALTAVLGILAYTVAMYQKSLDTVTADRVVPLRQLFELNEQLVALQSIPEDTLQSTIAAARVSDLRTSIAELWAQYVLTYLTQEEELLARGAGDALRNVESRIARYLELMQQGDMEGAVGTLDVNFQTGINDTRSRIVDLVQLQQRVSNDILNQTRAKFDTLRTIVIGLGLIALGLIAFILHLVRRFILSPIGYAKQALTSLAEGKLSPDLPISHADETDALLTEINRTRDRIARMAMESSKFEKRAEDFRLQLDAMFKHSPFGIFIKDAAGRVLAVNEEEARLWGRPREEIIGRIAADLIGPTDAQRMQASDRHVLETGEPISLIYRGTPDVPYEWLQGIKFPIRDNEGAIVAIGVLDLDISAEKEREREKEAITFQLSRSGKMAGIYYWSSHFDPITGVTSYSYDRDMLRSLTGRDEIPGDYAEYLKLTHPDDRAAIVPVYDDFTSGRIDTYQIRYRFQHKDGSWIPLKVWGERVRDRQTGCIDVYVASQDITDAIARETKLEEARRLAEIADLAKSEFLANMSHELRTPLNAVLGFSELLKFQYTKMSGEDAAKYVDMIHEGGRKLLSTINIILDFSRMEAAEMPSEEVAFNVTDAIMACVAQMRRRVEAIGVEISTEVEDDYCLIGDEKSIHHALVNILENASQFTPAGSRIETSVNANDLGEIAISVSDSGPGIEPRVLASVGKSFIRGGSVNTQQYGGLGLGLKIAQRLINLHGGRLEIENRSTGGACVRLVFPASRNLTQTGSTKASESLRG
jgi:PAS domain S-box-containing protein